MNALRAPFTALPVRREMCVHFFNFIYHFLIFLIFVLDRADAFIDGYRLVLFHFEFLQQNDIRGTTSGVFRPFVHSVQ
jgi:hypothetical protein